MRSVVHLGAGITASGAGLPPAELAVVVAVVVLLALVLVLRSRRSRDQKLRRGASEGYHDRDLAHYALGSASGARGPSLDPSSQPISPTFNSAPKSSKNKKRRTTVPTPVAPIPVPSFAPAELAHVGPLPAFDQATAQSLRPVPRMPPPPPATDHRTSALPPPPPPPGAGLNVPPVPPAPHLGGSQPAPLPPPPAGAAPSPSPPPGAVPMPLPTLPSLPNFEEPLPPPPPIRSEDHPQP